MGRVTRMLAGTVCVALVSGAGRAQQERGTWRAISTTARGVTGDVTFGNERLTINFASFAIAQIRALTPAEVAAAFQPTEGEAAGTGNLYRLSIPANKQFLHKNTMCGSEETQWMATYQTKKSLELAFFSGPQMPVLTGEALANTTALCGTYSYGR